MTMRAQAQSKYVKVSPYKLRPYVSPLRGCSVARALSLLEGFSLKRLVPVTKAIFSAYSNARQHGGAEALSMDNFIVKEICINQGPIRRYSKPAAKGRVAIQRRRLSHIHVIVEKV